MHALGQHVHQEPADELVRGQRHGLVAARSFDPVVIPQPHPHRARRTAAAPLPRDFVPWRFSRRRPPERMVRSSLPAAENLHRNGLMHRSKRPHGSAYSITSSASASNDAGTARESILAVWALITTLSTKIGEPLACSANIELLGGRALTIRPSP